MNEREQEKKKEGDWYETTRREQTRGSTRVNEKETTRKRPTQTDKRSQRGQTRQRQRNNESK